MKKVQLLKVFLILSVFAAPHLFGEPGCTGSTYAEPTCGGTCSQSYCQDVSFGQDGSLFQCCVSEMPKGLLYALLLIVSFLFILKKKKLAGAFINGKA